MGLGGPLSQKLLIGMLLDAMFFAQAICRIQIVRISAAAGE